MWSRQVFICGTNGGITWAHRSRGDWSRSTVYSGAENSVPLEIALNAPCLDSSAVSAVAGTEAAAIFTALPYSISNSKWQVGDFSIVIFPALLKNKIP